MQTQYNMIGYRTDLSFHDYKPAIEIDENGSGNRNIDYEIWRQKPVEQELSCEFVIINPVKDFDIFKAISEVLRNIRNHQTSLLNQLN